MDTPDGYTERSRSEPSYRDDWNSRAFTVGTVGPESSGKTALILALCQHLRDSHSVCVITNDTYSRDDWDYLVKSQALPEERIRAVETGGCPHAAIKESPFVNGYNAFPLDEIYNTISDYSLNMEEVKELTLTFRPQIVFIESGDKSSLANFSRELADYIIYVADATGGEKGLWKATPVVSQSDLLVINKTDLASAVGADLEALSREANLMRQDRPTLLTQAKHGVGLETAADSILSSFRLQTKA